MKGLEASAFEQILYGLRSVLVRVLCMNELTAFECSDMVCPSNSCIFQCFKIELNSLKGVIDFYAMLKVGYIKI